MPKLGMEAIRRRQVIDAVLQILEERGWTDLTILEVSRVAGVSSGVVIHYFGNKRDMVVDAVSEAVNRLARRLRETRKQATCSEQRLAAMTALLTDLRRHGLPGPALWIAVLATSPFDSLLRAEMERVRSHIEEAFVEAATQAVQLLGRPLDRSLREIAADYATLILGSWAKAVIDPSDTCRDRHNAAIGFFTTRHLGGGGTLSLRA